MSVRDTIGLIFGKKQAQIGGISLDASISEVHKYPSKVSKNPVESGAKVTDHVQLDPISVTIQGVISDTPLGLPIVGNIENFASTVATLFGKGAHSIDAHEKFLTLRESREPMDLVTGLKSYKNMVMEEYDVERDKDKANAIYFTATLTQLRIVESQTTSAPPASPDAADRAAKVKDSGQRKAEEVSADDPLHKNPNLSSKNSDPSDLFKIFGKISLPFGG